MLTPDVVWFSFSHAHGEGQAKVFKSQHSVLVSHRRAFLSRSWQEPEQHVTNLGVKVDFFYNVEVRGLGTVVSEKLGGAEMRNAIQKH